MRPAREHEDVSSDGTPAASVRQISVAHRGDDAEQHRTQNAATGPARPSSTVPLNATVVKMNVLRTSCDCEHGENAGDASDAAQKTT
jgi:hypothetical protein